MCSSPLPEPYETPPCKETTFKNADGKCPEGWTDDSYNLCYRLFKENKN